MRRREIAPRARYAAPCNTGRSISKSITNVLLILLILLILRFPGSAAFCISTSGGGCPVQVAMGGSHAKSW